MDKISHGDVIIIQIYPKINLDDQMKKFSLGGDDVPLIDTTYQDDDYDDELMNSVVNF